MKDAETIDELLLRIRKAKHFDIHYRPRNGIDSWKDPARCRGRLSISIDDADLIIKSLEHRHLRKVEESIHPNSPFKRYFFRYQLNDGTMSDIELFIKIYSPDDCIVAVESFHESKMPRDVFEEDAEWYEK